VAREVGGTAPAGAAAAFFLSAMGFGAISPYPDIGLLLVAGEPFQGTEA
jgi:hypothetical protein